MSLPFSFQHIIYSQTDPLNSNILIFILLVNEVQCCYTRQVDRDCDFLEQERIMDYSLLVGLHFREPNVAADLIPAGGRTPTGFYLSLFLQY